eukprot:366061-Chlamydomonas_euryale.AAC.3
MLATNSRWPLLPLVALPAAAMRSLSRRSMLSISSCEGQGGQGRVWSLSRRSMLSISSDKDGVRRHIATGCCHWQAAVRALVWLLASGSSCMLKATPLTGLMTTIPMVD